MTLRTTFIALKSPEEQRPAHIIPRLSDREHASLILLEDAVYNSVLASRIEEISAAASEILVSREDILARGFRDDDVKVGKLVGYDDIVDCIMERTERTITL